jgi:hypothetical protein
MVDASLFDDLFLGGALAAFLYHAHAQQGWPEPEGTRQRANQLYGQTLATRNRGGRCP